MIHPTCQMLQTWSQPGDSRQRTAITAGTEGGIYDTPSSADDDGDKFRGQVKADPGSVAGADAAFTDSSRVNYTTISNVDTRRCHARAPEAQNGVLCPIQDIWCVDSDASACDLNVVVPSSPKRFPRPQLQLLLWCRPKVLLFFKMSTYDRKHHSPPPLIPFVFI